ncbi:hypothetical protein [Xenorhabdus sp. BG5]|uniref:hypothetical protein n=1 Tax=Xenorhabdus sp. BG5 TaxID=2782014 RepID=UPI0030DC28E8
MSIILGSMSYVIGIIVAFTIFALLEKRKSNPEHFSFILLFSFLWPIGVILVPIVFRLCFLSKKYNQFVGRQS